VCNGEFSSLGVILWHSVNDFSYMACYGTSGERINMNNILVVIIFILVGLLASISSSTPIPAIVACAAWVLGLWWGYLTAYGEMTK
jgi:hypothetical protein